MTDPIRLTDRSPEEIALLNPAFMGVVLYHAVQGYEQESQSGMPYPLVFLVPAVVLMRNTRSLLPRQKNSSLAGWLQDNPRVRLRFADASVSFVPLVREGLILAASKRALMLVGDHVHAGNLRRGALARIQANTDEFQEITRKSSFVGRWYAVSGSTETIMALWGVRP